MTELTKEKSHVTVSEMDHVRSHLVEIAKNEKFSDPRFRVSEYPRREDNFLGEIFRATIEGQRNGKYEKIRLVLKYPPREESHKLMFTLFPAYPREIKFYREIVPIFKDLLAEYRLTLDNVPKFYGANSVKGEEILFLEDMLGKRYENRDRLKLLDYPHASIAVKNLAKLHGYGFVLRGKKPEIFQKIQNLEDIMFVGPFGKNQIFLTRLRHLCNVAVKSIENEDRRYVDKLRNFVDDFPSKMTNVCDGNLAEPYATLCHGDAWTSNCLFKYEDEEKTKPTHMYFVDFQLCRYAAPITDLTYMIFCCCSKETRDRYYDRLLEDYYESLSGTLQKMDCDPEILYPISAFEDQLKKFGCFGTGMAITTIQLFTKVNATLEPSDPYFETEDLVDRLKTDNLYRTMLVDTIKDSVDYGYI